MNADERGSKNSKQERTKADLGVKAGVTESQQIFEDELMTKLNWYAGIAIAAFAGLMTCVLISPGWMIDSATARILIGVFCALLALAAFAQVFFLLLSNHRGDETTQSPLAYALMGSGIVLFTLLLLLAPDSLPVASLLGIGGAMLFIVGNSTRLR